MNSHHEPPAQSRPPHTDDNGTSTSRPSSPPPPSVPAPAPAPFPSSHPLPPASIRPPLRQKRTSFTAASTTASRPSSMASNSSAGESSSTRFAVSPSLLSPSLATALGIGGVEGRKHGSSGSLGGGGGGGGGTYPQGASGASGASAMTTGSLYSSAASASSSSSLAALAIGSPLSAASAASTSTSASASASSPTSSSSSSFPTARRSSLAPMPVPPPAAASSSSSSSSTTKSAAAAASSATTSSSSTTTRRPSLPNVTYLSHHRCSTISVSSFESLPEEHSLPTFAGTPFAAASATAASSSTSAATAVRGRRSSDGRLVRLDRLDCRSSPAPESPSGSSTSSAAAALMLPPTTLPAHRGPRSSFASASTMSSSSSTSSYGSLPSSPNDSAIQGSAPIALSQPGPPPSPTKLHHSTKRASIASPTTSTAAGMGPIDAVKTASRPRRALKRSQTEPASAVMNSSAMTSEAYADSIRKRGLIARELLTTEQAFVESLRVLNEAFYQPLLLRAGGLRGSPTSDAGPVILSKKALLDIFSNFVDILQLNTELLGQLEERIGGKPRLDRSKSLAAVRREASGSQSSNPTSAASDTTPFPTAEKAEAANSGDHSAPASRFSSPPLSNSPAAWDPEVDTIGDILLPIAPFLKLYSLFVKNFSSALARIETERKENDAFAKFLRETERSTWGRGKAFFGLGLQAHLLTIVQRIPRYKLLVGDLLHNTPSVHRDYLDLQKAFVVIEQVASTINENVRQHEMVILMLALQRSMTNLASPLVVPGRALLRRGTLLKACRKDIQPRAFFLFTDCLVYARPPSGGGTAAIEAAWNTIVRAGGGIATAGLPSDLAGPWSPPPPPPRTRTSRTSLTDRSNPNSPRIPPPPSDGLYPRPRISSGNLFSTNVLLDVLHTQAPQLQFREKYSLQDCTVIGIEDNSASTYHATASSDVGGTPFPFEIRTPDKSFAVYAESAESREAWLTAIRDARNEWLQARMTLRAEEDSIEAKRDRRRSVAATAASAKPRHSITSWAMLGLASPAPTPDGRAHGLDVVRGQHTVEPVTQVDATHPLPPGGLNVLRSPHLHGADATTTSNRTTSLPSLQSSSGGTFAALLGGAAGGPFVENSAHASVGAPSNLGPLAAPLRVLEDYNAPAWVPDSRADRCMACTEPFAVWRRKHHCRLCGRVVCWACSTKKFAIASYEDGKEDMIARACDACYESTFPSSDSEGEDERDEAVDEDGLDAAPATQGPASDGSAAKVAFPSMENTSSRPRSFAAHTVRFETDLQPLDEGARVEETRQEQQGQANQGHEPTASPSSHVDDANEPSASKIFAGIDAAPTPAVHSDDPSVDAHLSMPETVPSRPVIKTHRAGGLTARFPSMASMNPTREGRGPREKLHLDPWADIRTTPSGATTSLSNPYAQSLFGQVQAATSGSGTFRLAPPRITTPEDEVPPDVKWRPLAHRRRSVRTLGEEKGPLGEPSGSDQVASDQENAAAVVNGEDAQAAPSGPGAKRSLIGQGESYFGAATFADVDAELRPSCTPVKASGPNDAAVQNSQARQILSDARNANGGHLNSQFGPGCTPTHVQVHPPARRKRPAQSAAARLSTYYGGALGILPQASASTSTLASVSSATALDGEARKSDANET